MPWVMMVDSKATTGFPWCKASCTSEDISIKSVKYKYTCTSIFISYLLWNYYQYFQSILIESNKYIKDINMGVSWNKYTYTNIMWLFKMKFLHNFLKNSFDNFLNRLTWGKLSDAQHICSWTYPPPKSQHFAADFIHTSYDSLRIFRVLYKDPCKEYTCTPQAACFNWYNLWFSRLLEN